MGPLLNTVLEHIQPPAGDPAADFALLVAMVEHDAHLGRVATGRVASGTAKIGDRLKLLPHAGASVACLATSPPVVQIMLRCECYIHGWEYVRCMIGSLFMYLRAWSAGNSPNGRGWSPYTSVQKGCLSGAVK